MTPVLLKPGGEDSSQVVVLGRAVADVTALSYRPMKAALLEQGLASLEELRARFEVAARPMKAAVLEQVLASLEDLRSRFDVVVCEGAGSPTEINLRADDIANMGLATAANLPVVVVGDIDRGGVFPALYGTVALMPPADQRLVAGFLVNKFRGDVRLLPPRLGPLTAPAGRPPRGARAAAPAARVEVRLRRPGLEQRTPRPGRPTLGVLPWLPGAALDVEDSLGIPTGV